MSTEQTDQDFDASEAAAMATARKWHMAFNAAFRSMRWVHHPACDGPTCEFCLFASSSMTRRSRSEMWTASNFGLDESSSSSEGASLAAQELVATRSGLMFWQGAAKSLEQRLAEVTRHLTEAQTSGWCDVCCGTGKPTADVPCMCGGTGLAADAVIHLRERLFKVEQRAEATIATLRDLMNAHRLNCRTGAPDPDAALAAPAAGTPAKEDA